MSILAALHSHSIYIISLLKHISHVFPNTNTAAINSLASIILSIPPKFECNNSRRTITITPSARYFVRFSLNVPNVLFESSKKKEKKSEIESQKENKFSLEENL